MFDFGAYVWVLLVGFGLPIVLFPPCWGFLLFVIFPCKVFGYYLFLVFMIVYACWYCLVYGCGLSCLQAFWVCWFAYKFPWVFAVDCLFIVNCSG